VVGVPITPMAREGDPCTAARAPASITSSTGMPAARSLTTWEATAAIVLQAMMSIFTPCSSR